MSRFRRRREMMRALVPLEEMARREGVQPNSLRGYLSRTFGFRAYRNYSDDVAGGAELRLRVARLDPPEVIADALNLGDDYSFRLLDMIRRFIGEEGANMYVNKVNEKYLRPNYEVIVKRGKIVARSNNAGARPEGMFYPPSAAPRGFGMKHFRGERRGEYFRGERRGRDAFRLVLLPLIKKGAPTSQMGRALGRSRWTTQRILRMLFGRDFVRQYERYGRGVLDHLDIPR